MPNKLIESIKLARENKWCTSPYCTLCGAREYRQLLIDLNGCDTPLNAELIDALCSLNPSELTNIDDWQGPLLVAIIDLPWHPEQILESWLTKITDDIAFTDFVLYRIVRHCSKENPVVKEWIKTCLMLAKESNSFSFTESLLLVLRRSSLGHTDLIEQAKEFARSSPQMRRVLRNTCDLNL